jgi:poly(ribitol-phosphate) beta-N-acetylglucosaminyltransferase
MAAYNAGPYLEPSINSLVNQTLDPRRMEVIIIDDGSTDGTAERLDEHAAAHPDLLRVVHQENSGGPAAPRNVGLDMARGRYVFFLDADDYLGPESLERLVQCAEENGSDVVLGRMKGIGGRGVPVSMYHKNDPDADLFSSRVYWTLNAGKLYRRELIERLKMRFMTDMPNGSDQPFTARAYLNARRISVLADYDFYHAVLRGDGRHVTLSGGAESRVLLLERTTGIVADHVEPGPRRDALMLRHFRVDMTHLLNHLARESDPAKQRQLFGRIKVMVDAYYTDRIDEALDPLRRLRYHLVRHGRLDQLVEVYRFWSSKRPHRIVVEGDRAFAALPYFRDPAIGLPDSVFDTTDRLALRHWMGTGELAPDGTLRVAGYAYLERIDHAEARYALLVRHRTTGQEYRVQARRTAPPAATTEEDLTEPESHGRVGFEVECDIRTMAAGMPLEPGTWDLFVEIVIQGVVRTGRLGSRRDAAIPSAPSVRIVRASGHGRPALATETYFTDPRDNLSLIVGAVALRHGLRVESLSWADGAELEVRGIVEIEELPPDALTLRLSRSGGDERLVAVSRENGTFTARVPVRRLGWGDWALEMGIRADGTDWHVPLSINAGLRGSRWMRLGRPGRASLVGSGRLRVAPVDVIGAVRRRVGRLVGRAHPE